MDDPIPLLLSTLSGMGVEVFVRDRTVKVRFMDPWRIFDRERITDEQRIAAVRNTSVFQEMLRRQDEVVEHWLTSPGHSIENYPDEQRRLTHRFQDSLIDDYRRRGLIRKVGPHSAKELWFGGRYR
jgi:hypothetical protein